MKRKKRSFGRRIVVAVSVILAILVVFWLGMNVRTFSSQLRLLNEFHLPVSCIFNIDQYAYWNDFLKYTDGYEIMRIDVDAGKWKTPDIWNVSEATLSEMVQPYGLGFSSALRDKSQSGMLTDVWQEWFVSEKKPDGNFDGWEFFVGAYDGEETLFLYRGHHLYGDADLRITG